MAYLFRGDFTAYKTVDTVFFNGFVAPLYDGYVWFTDDRLLRRNVRGQANKAPASVKRCREYGLYPLSIGVSVVITVV